LALLDDALPLWAKQMYPGAKYGHGYG